MYKYKLGFQLMDGGGFWIPNIKVSAYNNIYEEMHI